MYGTLKMREFGVHNLSMVPIWKINVNQGTAKNIISEVILYLTTLEMMCNLGQLHGFHFPCKDEHAHITSIVTT